MLLIFTLGVYLNAFTRFAPKSALGCHVDLGSGTTASCSLRGPRVCLSGGSVRQEGERKLRVSSASLPMYGGCISTVHGGNIRILIAKG